MTRQEAENVGIEIAVEIAMKIRDIVDGIYMMTPFNRVEMVSKIIKSIK
jgi:homocysteine S-methyltransferase